MEICSGCHPFFTGKQKLMDTAGRVERFQRKYGDYRKKQSRQGRRQVTLADARSPCARPVNEMPTPKRERRLQIGGQAVIEGVMMRSPTAHRDRRARGPRAIVVRDEPFRSLVRRHRMLNVPDRARRRRLRRDASSSA